MLLFINYSNMIVEQTYGLLREYFLIVTNQKKMSSFDSKVGRGDLFFFSLVHVLIVFLCA